MSDKNGMKHLSGDKRNSFNYIAVQTDKGHVESHLTSSEDSPPPPPCYEDVLDDKKASSYDGEINKLLLSVDNGTQIKSVKSSQGQCLIGVKIFVVCFYFSPQ